jgi:hypothetical protein
MACTVALGATTDKVAVPHLAMGGDGIWWTDNLAVYHGGSSYALWYYTGNLLSLQGWEDDPGLFTPTDEGSMESGTHFGIDRLLCCMAGDRLFFTTEDPNDPEPNNFSVKQCRADTGDISNTGLGLYGGVFYRTASATIHPGESQAVGHNIAYAIDTGDPPRLYRWDLDTVLGFSVSAPTLTGPDDLAHWSDASDIITADDGYVWVLGEAGTKVGRYRWDNEEFVEFTLPHTATANAIALPCQNELGQGVTLNLNVAGGQTPTNVKNDGSTQTACFAGEFETEGSDFRATSGYRDTPTSYNNRDGGVLKRNTTGFEDDYYTFDCGNGGADPIDTGAGGRRGAYVGIYLASAAESSPG